MLLSDVAGIGINAAYAEGADSVNFTNLNDDDWFSFQIDPSTVEQVFIDFSDIGGVLGFQVARANGVVILNSTDRDRDFEFDFETGNFIGSGVRITIEDPSQTEYLIRVFALILSIICRLTTFRLHSVANLSFPKVWRRMLYEDNERFFEGYNIASFPGVPLSALEGFATLTIQTGIVFRSLKVLKIC